MDYFFIILPKMCGFLLLVLVGFLAGRMGIIRKDSLNSLSGLLLKIVLPALVISLIWENQTTLFSIKEYGRIVIGQVGVYITLALTGVVVSRFFAFPKEQRNVYRGCMVGGNYGFVVIPLIMALFQNTGGTRYIPICSVVDTVVVWTLGFFLFTRGIGEKEHTWKKILLNPVFLAILIGLCLTTLHVPVPDMVMDVVTSVGDTSYSWGLMYLGCSLSFLDFSKARKYRSILALGISKLLVVPLGIFLVSAAFLPQQEALILMMIAGAPSMTTSVMIAQQYGLDEDYASAVVAVTTICAMVTIPMLFLIVLPFQYMA